MPIKLRFKLELIFLYLKRHWILFSTLTILVSVSIIFRQQLFNFYTKLNPPIQKIGLEGLYSLNNFPEEIAQKISYGLTQSDDSGHFSTSPLVKNLDINPEHNQYTFEIDPQLSWHRGKKLTAKNINYQIPGLEFSYPDYTHVVVKSNTTFSPILSTLSKSLIKKNFDGLGTHVVKRYRYSEGNLKTLLLKSTDNSILYRFYQHENDLINAFKIGEVDQITLTNDPQELANWPNTNLSKDVRTDERYIALFINTKKLASKSLRQALAYATPKTNDLNDRAISPISPSSWAYNPEVKAYNYDPARAKELFKNNEIESLSLVYNDQRLVSLADEIKKAWQEILNINVDAHIDTQIDLQNYDIILAYGSIPTDPDQYVFWHSTQQKTNLTHLDHPPIDKLLEEGRQSFDVQERKKIYQEFQKILLEECPAIFLKYPTYYTISRKT